MKPHPISPALESSYQGAGYALAAITAGQLVALRYISDFSPPEVADAIESADEHALLFIRRWLDTPSAGQLVRQLQALGEVSVGMCSSWVFCEL